MDDDLDALRDLARTFCEKEIAPHSARFIEQHHVDRDLWTRRVIWGCCACQSPNSTAEVVEHSPMRRS